MNWPKKGPKLKKPKLKPPAFLADLYYDMRDRRLLLPLALVLVAIAAVPFLIGSDSEPLPPLPAQSAAELEAATGRTSSLAVVESTPGLRDYKKRLGDRTATNPFKQRHTGLPDSVKLESTSSSGGGSETVTIEDGSTTVEVETGGSGGDAGSTGGDAGNDAGSTPRLELVINAQIRRVETKPDGREVRGELETRKNVPVLAKLPGTKTPVVTLMGFNVSTERLVFLVSHEVESIKGEFVCITRAEVCELLEVGIGTLLEFTYEPSGARYELKVTGAKAIRARKRGKANGSRAPLNRAYSGIAWIEAVDQLGLQNFSK
jgi:hypothetical protein